MNTEPIIPYIDLQYCCDSFFIELDDPEYTKIISIITNIEILIKTKDLQDFRLLETVFSEIYGIESPKKHYLINDYNTNNNYEVYSIKVNGYNSILFYINEQLRNMFYFDNRELKLSSDWVLNNLFNEKGLYIGPERIECGLIIANTENKITSLKGISIVEGDLFLHNVFLDMPDLIQVLNYIFIFDSSLLSYPIIELTFPKFVQKKIIHLISDRIIPITKGKIKEINGSISSSSYPGSGDIVTKHSKDFYKEIKRAVNRSLEDIVLILNNPSKKINTIAKNIMIGRLNNQKYEINLK